MLNNWNLICCCNWINLFRIVCGLEFVVLCWDVLIRPVFVVEIDGQIMDVLVNRDVPGKRKVIVSLRLIKLTRSLVRLFVNQKGNNTDTSFSKELPLV